MTDTNITESIPAAIAARIRHLAAMGRRLPLHVIKRQSGFGIVSADNLRQGDQSIAMALLVAETTIHWSPGTGQIDQTIIDRNIIASPDDEPDNEPLDWAGTFNNYFEHIDVVDPKSGDDGIWAFCHMQGCCRWVPSAEIVTFGIWNQEADIIFGICDDCGNKLIPLAPDSQDEE